MRIGVSWRSARQRAGVRKSVPLADWMPILADRDALFVNLQYGDTDKEVAAAAKRSGAEIYTDPKIDRYSELEKLAALIDCLDLVITTSNVTAHLAGALGKETCLILQRAPLWYWGHQGNETTFYPSVRAFRQTSANSWDGVISAVAAVLDGRL